MVRVREISKGVVITLLVTVMEILNTLSGIVLIYRIMRLVSCIYPVLYVMVNIRIKIMAKVASSRISKGGGILQLL